MMALLRRELAASATPAFALAAALHVMVLAVFIVGWTDGRGAAPLAPRSLYEQLRLVQLVLLVPVLTWTACRTMAEERGRDLVLLSAVAAVAPAQFLFARALALVTVLGLVAFTGLPLALLTFRMTPVDIPTFARDEIMTLAVSFAAGATSLLSRTITASRLAGWAAAAAVTGVAVLLAMRVPYGPAVLVTGAIGLFVAIAFHASRSLLYLDELPG